MYKFWVCHFTLSISKRVNMHLQSTRDHICGTNTLSVFTHSQRNDLLFHHWKFYACPNNIDISSVFHKDWSVSPTVTSNIFQSVRFSSMMRDKQPVSYFTFLPSVKCWSVLCSERWSPEQLRGWEGDATINLAVWMRRERLWQGVSVWRAGDENRLLFYSFLFHVYLITAAPALSFILWTLPFCSFIVLSEALHLSASACSTSSCLLGINCAA